MYDTILKYVARYIELTPEETDIFTSLLTPRKVRKRQYLVQSGDICKAENFVVNGCLRSFYVDEKGEEYISQFAIEDWWITDLNSFLTQTPANYYVEALENSEVLQISYEAYHELLSRIPKFDRFFRIIIQKAYVATQQRIISTMSKTSEERYLEFVAHYPNIEQRVPQYMVAAYLGFTPEFLSKIRSRRNKLS